MSDTKTKANSTETKTAPTTLVLLDDLRQKHVYAFEKALTRMGGIDWRAANITAQHMMAAAIEAGWIVEPECEFGEFKGAMRHFYAGENIDDMHPGIVRKLGMDVTQLYNKIVEVPKN